MSTIKAKAFQHPSASSNNITFNADGTHTVNAQHPITSKNLFINGGMHVWRRSTEVTGITSAEYYTADRFYTLVSSGIGTWTQSRSTDVPSGQGFPYSLKMDCTTANTNIAANQYLSVEQKIEGQNLQHLQKGTSSAKKITLSFWVKSNKTGTYIVNILDIDNFRNISKAYTIDSASTWEKKELTFDGDTTGTLDNDNVASFRVKFWLGAGSNYTTGTLATSWESYLSANENQVVGQVNLADSTNNEWYLTGCQLEVGDQATSFEFEPYDVIENKCQRYFYAHEFATQEWIYNEGNTSTMKWLQVYFPTRMRSNSGSITLSSNITGGAVSGLSGTVSNIQLQNIAPTRASLRVTMTVNTGTARAMYHCDTFDNDFVYFDMEL